MKKLAVEKINKTYTFPLPGSKSRISVKYTRPQTHEGSISVVVSGWITNESKVQFPFNGTLVKSFGTNFKDIGKDLTDSLEQANEKAGNPIQDAYGFVNSKIVPSVPYDAMDDFFKGIKQRKTKVPSKNTEKTGPSTDKRKLDKNQPVEIDIESIQQENPALFKELTEKYKDISKRPYGIVYDDAGEKVSVILDGNWSIIPKKYLSIHKQQKSETEKNYESSYEYYMENREENPSAISLALVKLIMNYKNSKNIPIDDVDNKLLELKKKEEEQEKQQSQPTPKQDKSWIKNLFNR